MANLNKEYKNLVGLERLFVAVIRQAVRTKDYDFFNNGKCEKLADRLGVDVKMAEAIKNRVNRLRQKIILF